MLRSLFFACSLVAVLDAVVPSMMFGRPRDGFVNAGHRRHFGVDSKLAADDDPYASIRHTFDQKKDHFDDVSKEKFTQRYYYNPAYANKTIAGGQDIVFLMIGGEGEESGKWASDGSYQWLQWAKKFGAHAFDLEHRFFGPSRPINDMKTSSLRLLTTEQALEDIAYFITSMNQKMGFSNPKWITFGGSYPGMLSAMFRSKYPELTVGAVASSAPLNLKLDFYEYAEVVDAVLTDTDATCASRVRDAFTQMQQMSLSDDGRADLERIFHLEPAFPSFDKLSKAAINNFFANVFNVFQGMIQYTYDGQKEATKTDLTARSLCNIINKGNTTADTINNIWDLIVWFNQKDSGSNTTITSFANDYQRDVVDTLGGTDYAAMGEGVASFRGWMWLCCNEIGFMQTTDSDTIFGSTLPMNYFYDTCIDIFPDDTNSLTANGKPWSMDSQFVKAANDRAKIYYGGEDTFEATNLILPNGAYDPWHALGYYKDDTANNVISVLIPGAAHCSDMYPVYNGEPAGLPAARQKIEDFLAGLVDYKPLPPVIETTTKAATTASLTMAILVLLAAI